MRLNAKELLAVASQPSYKFDKEGVLFIREKQEGIFRRGDVFTERWFRLRGNLLFYCKSKDPYSEPVGLLVIEHCSVKADSETENIFPFTLDYVSDDHGGQQLGTATEVERETWMNILRSASFECMKSQVHSLKNKLHLKKGKLDVQKLRVYSFEENQSLSQLMGRYDPLQHEPFLELSLVCDNLKCDADGQPPNPMVLVYTCRTVQSSWVQFAQTEMIERSSNPCFLTTVGFLKREVSLAMRVKVLVFDVKEKVTATRTLLGESVFTLSTLLQTPCRFLRLTLISPCCESVGFITVSARELEPDVSVDDSNSLVSVPSDKEPIWPLADRQRTYSLPTSLPARATTPLHSQLKTLFDNITSQTYCFHTGLGAELRVHEIMAESRLCFSLPQLLLNLWIQEERKMMEYVQALGELRKEWQVQHSVALERHLHLINTYTQALDKLSTHQGPSFKPSSKKNKHSLEFVPVNLHLQRLWVQNITSRKTAVRDVVTMGAFTAYPHQYKQGGLLKLLVQLRNSYHFVSKDSTGQVMGPDRLSCAAEAILRIDQLQEEVEAELQHLFHLASQKSCSSMHDIVNRISSKAKQLIHVCNPMLVEEAIAVWESAKPVIDFTQLAKNSSQSHTQLHLGQSEDMCGISSKVSPDQGVKLQRQHSLPNSVDKYFNGADVNEFSNEDNTVQNEDTGQKLALSHNESSKIDNCVPETDAKAHSTQTSECKEKEGVLGDKLKRHSLCLPLGGIADMTLQKNNTALEELSSPLGMFEEFEPLDLTHLNIKASTMCMASKVQLLTNELETANGSAVRNLSPTNEVVGLHVRKVISESKQHKSNQDWIFELTPSARKLRQAMLCLQRTARLTYGFLSLKEPHHRASMSYMIRYRRDVVFSQALTTLVTGLMTVLWCQQPDPIFLNHLISAGLLAQFLGLLSCYGDEMGMLEDMMVGVEDLRRVIFWLEPARHSENTPQPRIEGNRAFLTLVVPAPESVMSMLPKGKQHGCRFSLTPVFLNIGINEQATLAEKFGDVSLQDQVNQEGVNLLKEYHRRCQKASSKVEKSTVRGIRLQEVKVDELLVQLQTQVQARKSKNISILHLGAEICSRLKGLRFTCCKSGKDRTSMSVTLEQSVVLQNEFDLDEKEVPRVLSCMRSEGTRRENTFKNVGVRKYAFNSLQLMALPKQYRPPPGTFGNVQS
ncbi:inositol polyphosphate-4-phosphatase type I A isoform X2 [Tachypleus tridentatus]|uniref:inositol polyphosphate-4-phosphatase type I A isoform X2 n=1 Tax=Tachypleus tridentatus TaxID=6853 RepID=UPI003FD6BCFD